MRISLIVLFVIATLNSFKAYSLSDSMILKTMKCSREIIENNIGGKEGIKVAALSLEELEMSPEFSLKSCKSYLSLNEQIVTSKEHSINYLNGLNISQKTREIIEGFISPIVACEKVGISAAVGAWFVGFGIKTGAAKCQSTNARQWLELTPGASYTPGFGASLSIHKGSLERRSDIKYIGIDTSKTSSFDTGFLLMFYNEDVVPSEAVSEDIRATGVDGIGVGFGSLYGESIQANLAFMPLGTKNSLLLELYLR